MTNSYDDSTIEIIPIEIYPTLNIYKLFLANKDIDKKDEIYIEIGDVEASNLYFNMNTDLFQFNRPDTHDLMIKGLESFNIKISSILITDYVDNVWYSEIELINTETKETTYIESKPSDSIVIALKLDIPINIYTSVIKKFNTQFKNKPNIKSATTGIAKEIYKKESLNLLPINKLEIIMNDFVNKEDYESAKKVKDIIENKKGRK